MKRKKLLFIELLVVSILIVILAIVAVPRFLRSQLRANLSLTYQRLHSLIQANQSYKLEHGIYVAYPHEIWRLTTPIVYLENWNDIEDPFVRKMYDSSGRDISNPVYYFWWNDLSSRVNNIQLSVSFYYHTVPMGETYYLFGSNGPHHRPNLDLVFDQNGVWFTGGYHSSNGLNSLGMILATDQQVIKN